MTIKEKLTAYSIDLPEPSKYIGVYVPVVVSGALAFVSGHTAVVQGKRSFEGKVGSDLTLEEGKMSARAACLNCLASLNQTLGSLDRVKKIIKLVGFVNSAVGFHDQPQTLNGASELLEFLWGEAGRHARSSVGVSELPSNASVEIELIVEVSNSQVPI